MLFNPFEQRFEDEIKDVNIICNLPQLTSKEKTIVIEKGKSYVALVSWVKPRGEETYRAIVRDGLTYETGALYWGAIGPVSYTHLDVYKRQLLILCHIRIHNK